MSEALHRRPDGPSDATLIAAVRRGDTGAYGLLYERHLGAAKRAAAYLVGTTAEREDLVAEAFTRVLQVLLSGRGPAQDFRPYLLVTMRHAAINAARKSPTTALFADVPDAYLPTVVEDPYSARLHGNEAASAFAGLPERWRLVLWHTEVEGASPAAIAPMLGMTPNGVAALAYRAREGLRQAYLRMHLPAAVERRECRAATDKLAGWVRRSISAPQRRKLTAHLDRCERCRELAAGLSEVNGDLAASAIPVVSWLSTLKGIFTATTVKVGTAAAIAAVTAVSVVASEAPPDRAAPALAGPIVGLPAATQTNAEIRGRGVTGPPAAPLAGEQVAPAELPTTETSPPDSPGAKTAPKTKEKATKQTAENSKPPAKVKKEK